jgi:hypothetical protein
VSERTFCQTDYLGLACLPGCRARPVPPAQRWVHDLLAYQLLVDGTELGSLLLMRLEAARLTNVLNVSGKREASSKGAPGPNAFLDFVDNSRHQTIRLCYRAVIFMTAKVQNLRTLECGFADGRGSPALTLGGLSQRLASVWITRFTSARSGRSASGWQARRSSALNIRLVPTARARAPK